MYIALFTNTGQSVELLCNVSLNADIMWTYDTGDPYVHYVYWKGRTDSDKVRLATKSTGRDFHSLIISDVQLNDSGLYNCYDDGGSRKAGYQLVVNGM